MKFLIKIAFVFSFLLFVSSCTKHEQLSLKKELTSQNEVKSGDFNSDINDVSITDPENEEDIDVNITDPENEEDKEVN